LILWDNRMKAKQSMSLRLDRLTARHRQILRLVRDAGALSRTALHQSTAIRLRTVGQLVGELERQGYLIPADTQADNGIGRPRVPMRIDPARRHVVGIDLMRSGVEAARIGLLGEPLGATIRKDISDPGQSILFAARLARRLVDERTVAVGIGITGFVDPVLAEHLATAPLPGRRRTSLAPLLAATAGVPVVIDNETHGQSARWAMMNRSASEDCLIVLLEDGRLAASLLLGVRPNRGCVVAANELGHTTLPVKTVPCYCGQVGCLERIFSTGHLHSRGLAGNLAGHLAHPPASWRRPVREMVDLLCRGLSNAINLIRPHRLVVVSTLGSADFSAQVEQIVRSRLLAALAERVVIDWQQPPIGSAAVAAGCLALRELYGFPEDPGFQGG
jgi:predicted NBD/HSP70 family sugar kinase